MINSVREPAHFAYIDAVRGYAFLGVMSVHCAVVCGPFPGSKIAIEGSYGVQLFFLASAITLCNSMAARREGCESYVNFYLRRFFRIAPLFWFAIILYWTIPNLLPSRWLGQWAPEGVRPSYFILTALFLHGWHPYTFNSIVPGGWSIAVEVAFYAVFPFCFAYITNLRRAAVCFFGAIVFTVLERYVFQRVSGYIWPRTPHGGIIGFFEHLWFPSQFVYFLLGIFTYYLIQEPAAAQIYRSRSGSWYLFVLAMLFLISMLNHDFNGYMPPILVVVVLAALIVSMAGNMISVVNPVICHIGKLSFSCYITHFAALALVLRFLHSYLQPYSIQTPEGIEAFDAGSALANFGLFALFMVLTLVLTVLFSTVTHRLIENPGIALGKYVIRRWHGTQTVAVR